MTQAWDVGNWPFDFFGHFCLGTIISTGHAAGCVTTLETEFFSRKSQLPDQIQNFINESIASFVTNFIYPYKSNISKFLSTNLITSEM